MEFLVQDLRFAWRILFKNAGFATMAIATLALGIGGITAIFSVVNGVLLRPLPYGEPERLVTVNVGVRSSGNLPPPVGMPIPAMADWRIRSRSFQGILDYAAADLALLEADSPQLVKAHVVTPNFGDVLGVQPIIGRSFVQEDVSESSGSIGSVANVIGASTSIGSVAIVSDGFWRTNLGGDPRVIGRQLRTDRGMLTVIGVMPRTFAFPPLHSAPSDVWIPVQSRIPRSGPPLARLNAVVSVQSASRELNEIIESIRNEHPATGNLHVQLNPLLESMIGTNWRMLLKVLFAAVAFVLLVALANIANLILARNSGRQHEIAIRTAIGSTRTRVVRQLLVESLLLSIMGGLFGLIIAYWGVQLILAILPPTFPRVEEIGLDLNVLAFMIGTVFLSAILFGAIPAITCSNPSLERMLKEGSRGSSESPWSRRFRFVLIKAEVALATLLLAGGLLLADSFVHLLRIPLGIDIDHVITLKLSLPRSRYPNAIARREFLYNLNDRIELQPNVRTAVSNMSTLDPTNIPSGSVWWDGPQQGRARVSFLEGSSEVFQILKMQFKAGRAFRDGERAIVVTEAFSREYFSDPIGRQIYVSSATNPMTIVGVVANFSQSGLSRGIGPPLILPPAASASGLLIRVGGDPSAAMLAIRQQLASLDPELVPHLSTLRESFNQSQPVAQPRFRAAIFGAFAVISLLLAFMGVYSVTSYAAVQRRQEVGIRLALGGGRFQILGMMMFESLKPVLIGIALGMAGAFALAYSLPSYFAETRLTNPLIYAIVPMMVVFVAIAATWIPLLRSTGIDPLHSLRSQ